MPGSTILFTDIVGFSRVSSERQVQLASELQATAREMVAAWLTPPTGSPELVALPTGDGVALIFLSGERPSWTFADVLRATTRLTRWASQRDVELCVGLHAGNVEIITDVNTKPNICGDAINMAQRVLSAADDGQVLFSETIIRERLGDGRRLEFDLDGEKMVLEAGEEVTVYAKHDRPHQVVPVALRKEGGDEEPGWSSREPRSASVLPVSLTELPKDVEGFGVTLGEAHSVALVQLTGENLLAALESGQAAFSDELRKLWVLMPDPDAPGDSTDGPPLAQLRTLRDCVERWKARLAKEKAQRPAADVRLFLFQEPPFLGGSFLNWEEPGGRVHVSPYVWGLAARECPGFDLTWRSRKRHPVYERYVRGLETLTKLGREVDL